MENDPNSQMPVYKFVYRDVIDTGFCFDLTGKFHFLI